MVGGLTFGQRVGAGFALTLLLMVIISAIAIWSLGAVVAAKDRVLSDNAQSVIEAERLRASVLRMTASTRGYLLVKADDQLRAAQASRNEFKASLARLQPLVADDEARRLLDQVAQAEPPQRAAVERALSARQAGEALDTVARTFDQDVAPRTAALERQIDAFVQREERLLEDGRRAASATAGRSIILVVVIAGATVLLGAAFAFWLTRSLSRQIGAAVQHVQSSSSELQSSANQQATGAKEQATAMAEISTTIDELLVTSRQIADSARQVAQIAEETVRGARAGDDLVQRAQESAGAIRRQVDVIVNHMLDLGRQSQQIGGILEIINELAEQTNILAINATIEAAGVGESGRRFAVVADEIRKLADRVAGSTRDIRSLIELIRASVNATVMATESGSKAVDAGTRQFAEVASAFKHIAGLVVTTSEAAQEIELSTKQQATAVEQVKIAIANAAQATREAEASSSQTLQTASQLTGLSRDLARLIRPGVGA